MTFPVVNGFQTYKGTGTSVTVDIENDIPPDAVGAMYQVVLGLANPTVAPTGGGIPSLWTWKYSNVHGVGTQDLGIYEHTATDLTESQYTFTWTGSTDYIAVVVWHELVSGDLPGVIESGGFIDADRSGTDFLDLGTIDADWDDTDTSFIQYWLGNGISSISNTGAMGNIFLQQQGTALTLAGYSIGVNGADSYTTQTSVLNPANNTLSWVGIGKALRKAVGQDYLGFLGSVT